MKQTRILIGLCTLLTVACTAAMNEYAVGARAQALAAADWENSEWISAADAKIADENCRKAVRAADGTSWFVRRFENADEIESAVWMTSGLGVYEIYVNGRRVGDDILKPGFTHVKKTRRAFTYDVTALLRRKAGESNVLMAEVSSGWWRDKIVNYTGRKSAFRGVLRLRYANGETVQLGTRAKDWLAGVGGPVVHAGIFDGEEYDARIPCPKIEDPLFKPAERNDEFKGEILPTDGAEVCLRADLRLRPVAAYIWKGVDGADPGKGRLGRVHRVRDGAFDGASDVVLQKGETLVVDYGQNAAAVPAFVFKAAEGTTLTCLSGEMLNDRDGEKERGNDGPGGSVYRRNLRTPETGMRCVYTFGSQEGKGSDGFSAYVPTFTFFGYRYLSITATGAVTFKSVDSLPVTSIAKDLELGTLTCGDAAVNRFVKNVYWGMLSNYLSVPTDCPQRSERMGWMADTQVFVDAGAYIADTRTFFRKWMRDVADTQSATGAFSAVSPWAQYGAGPTEMMRVGWADAGVIVPWKVWRQFGDRGIVDQCWQSMEKFVDHVAETRYAHEAIHRECGGYQWADWLSWEKFQSYTGCQPREYCSFIVENGRTTIRPGTLAYWDFLGGSHWALDARMMCDMAGDTGRDAAKYERMYADVQRYLRDRFFNTADGTITPVLGDMQTPAVFALQLGLVEGVAREKTIAALRASLKTNGNRTGFLGASWLMDTLTACGEGRLAVDLLLNHKFPSWLYSVDQGATTVWERWDGWTAERGFGTGRPCSYNHYAYGAVLAWMYRSLAGIAPDVRNPGFKNILMAPIPDRRLGSVSAEYKSAAGLIKSRWAYEQDGMWTWTFEIPAGATAEVTIPGESASHRYTAGTYTIRRPNL